MITRTVVKRLGLGFVGAFCLVVILGAAFGKTLGRWYFLPRTTFVDSPVPPPPDYAKAANWAALPTREDFADVVPPESGASDNQATAKVDVFFLHPTTYYSGASWNGSTTNPLIHFVTDRGILTQQASAFNGAAKVYAPRYRQVTQGAHADEDRAAVQAAHDLAYTDVHRAFVYFLEHFNNDRPFLIAGHSQGTTHATRLVADLFEQFPDIAPRLVAAYLIGNEVQSADLEPYLPICGAPDQTGCYLSWNSVLRGGDGSHWKERGEPVCVNPLTWKTDGAAAGAELNLGGIPLVGLSGLDDIDSKLTGARCRDGILWIDEPREPGYTFALFPGGGYHTYDYNLFYMNIRENAERRVEAFLNKASDGPAQ